MSTGVLVIGDPGRLRGLLGYDTAVPSAATTRFDNRTDTWTVTTADGQTRTARILVDTTESNDEVVAVHGVPNHFRIPGPHTDRQARYVAGCLDAVRRGGATRIEARSRIRVHRRLPTRGPSRFYLTGSVGADDEVYDGPATLIHDGQEHPARVRLAGHVDPIDGQYHWQGTLFAELPGDRVTGSRVSIRIGEHSGAARVAERTPWGTLAVVGVAGYPPFPLPDVEVALPPRAAV
ncbi:DUF4873 domain-containing protein [Mycobacterium sp. pUA109]|uniref:DUF4873 domain-containing protein n=1 Tax=Mycobacterium sp. pUA109 TaxID=3238982 RepID=UPI00351B7D6C